MVTVLLVPTSFVSKVPVAPLASSATSSPATCPESEAPEVSRVAPVLPSYTLLPAVMPVAVNVAAVMSAVVVGAMMM